MSIQAEIPDSLKPGYEMQIPESVQALAMCVNFWQPHMDTNYKAVNRPPDMKPQKSAYQILNWLARRDRGDIWKQVNAEIVQTGLPNTKANRKAIYLRITQQKAGKMEV